LIEANVITTIHHAAMHPVCLNDKKQLHVRFLLIILCDSVASGQKETKRSDLNDKFVFLLCGGGDTLRGDHYRILVINTPENYMIQNDYQWMRENLRFLLDIEWKAIFDFDCNGHIFNFFESEEMVVKETTSDEFDEKSEFNLRHPDKLQRLVDDIQHSAKQPSWIFVNGRGTEQAYLPLQWNTERARSFKSAVQFFSKVFPDGRANVVFLLFSPDIDVLLIAASEFLTVFPNQWMCAVQDEDTGNKWIRKLKKQYLIDSDERVVVGMPWSHVNETVPILHAPKRRRGCEIPLSTGGTVLLPYKMTMRLPDIEVLGCNECDTEYERHDKQQQKELEKEEEQKFYRGEPPTWWNFWFPDQFCERKIYDKLKKIVEEALRPSSGHDFVDRVRIYHQPGAGGTTLAKHIIWTLRSNYRVGIVEKCSNRLSLEEIEKIVSQIMDFHGYKETEQANARPVLLLLDNPEDESESLLLSELGERAKTMVRPGDKNPVVCVFLECIRITEMSTTDYSYSRTFDRNCVYLKHELSPREILWFEKKGKELQDDFEAHAPNSVNPDCLISFNILKSNFNPEFMSNTVGALVKAITNEKERKLLKYVSLLNAFDIQYRGVPLAAFDEMMRECRIVGKRVVSNCWENELSDAFHVLMYVTLEPSIGYTRALCSKNALLAKESLEALWKTSDGSETVSEAALEFFKCSVFAVNCKSREKMLNIVKDVLKKRERLPSGVHSGEFSPLILHISQTQSSKKAKAVLKEGYKLTQDPFVAQQLARLYIKREKWYKASEVIKSAIDQLPDNSYLWDTYGRIYEKQLSSEYAAYKNSRKRLTLDQITEVVDLGLKGIGMFQRGQSAGEMESTANDVGYYGELEIICTLIDCLMCCDAMQNQSGKELRKFLLHETFIPAHLHFLRDVSGSDYIRILKDLKPRVDIVLKRLEDEKLELKLNVKYLQSPPANLVKLKERLNYYFGEDPNQIPEDLSESDQCLFRRRQIRRLAGLNMNSIFELRWKDEGENSLMEVRHIIKKNIRSAAASAIDFLIAISTNLALTSTNPESCKVIKFDRMLRWSTKLYETRKTLSIQSKTNVIYLEPYLFMTMFNWPREKTAQTFVPSEVEYAVTQWKEEFYKKYPRLNKEGKTYHKKETTLFFLASGSGMESIYTPKHDSRKVNEARGAEFWQQEQTKMKLQRFEGVLERGGTALNYHFSGSTLNIPTSLPILDRSWWRKKVYFVIGFSWAGPKAYDVSLENPSSMPEEQRLAVHLFSCYIMVKVWVGHTLSKHCLIGLY